MAAPCVTDEELLAFRSHPQQSFVEAFFIGKTFCMPKTPLHFWNFFGGNHCHRHDDDDEVEHAGRQTTTMGDGERRLSSCLLACIFIHSIREKPKNLSLSFFCVFCFVFSSFRLIAIGACFPFLPV